MDLVCCSKDHPETDLGVQGPASAAPLAIEVNNDKVVASISLQKEQQSSQHTRPFLHICKVVLH